MDHSKYAQTWAELDEERKAALVIQQELATADERRSTSRFILILTVILIAVSATLALTYHH